MMYLVLDVQSTQHTQDSSQLNAWVNVKSHREAVEILHTELSQEGWALTDIIESSPTEESDYFPPCPGLDAFHEAKKKLFVIQFI